MLKVHLLLLTFLAAFAAARNCKTGLAYCGSTLLSIGNYTEQVDEALTESSLSTDESTANNTLFNCVGGDNGNITVIRLCTHHCQDGGADNSDYCSGGASSTASETSASSTVFSTQTSSSQTTATNAPASTTTGSDKDNDNGGGTPVGAIVGGVVGGVAAIGLVGLVAFLFFRLKAKSKQQQMQTQPSEPSIGPNSMSPATAFNDAKVDSPAAQYTMLHEIPDNSDARHELA